MGRRSSKVDPRVEDAPLANFGVWPGRPWDLGPIPNTQFSGLLGDRSPPRPEVPLTQKSLAPAT